MEGRRELSIILHRSVTSSDLKENKNALTAPFRSCLLAN